MIKVLFGNGYVDREAYESAMNRAYGGNTNKIRTILTYENPVELYYGKRSGYVTSKTHTVKRLFWKGKKGPYYIPKSHRSRGYRLPMGASLENVEVNAVRKDYATQWSNIAKSMRKHGINASIAEDIEKHLAGETEYIEGFQNYHTRYNKPKKMSFKDVVGNLSIQEMKDSATHGEFGGKTYYKRNYGSKRDRSVQLYQGADGNWNFTAASEYAGWGNGDYYVMYSPTMAFYAETD